MPPNNSSRSQLIAAALVTGLIWLVDRHLTSLPAWIAWIVFLPHRLLLELAKLVGVGADNQNIFAVMFGLPAIAIYWAAVVTWLSRRLSSGPAGSPPDEHTADE